MLAALVASCGQSESTPELTHVSVRIKAGSDVDLASLVWPAAVRQALRLPQSLELGVDRRALTGPLTLAGPGVCPVTVGLDSETNQVEVSAL
ncbi:MAG: hypothetical protein U0263_41975 [Polyangiaceae bacterium]